MTDTSAEMQTGAVAVLDALGFKGIWKRPDIRPAEVIAKLASVKPRAVRHAERSAAISHRSDRIHPDVRFIFFSDSIIMTCLPTPGTTDLDRMFALSLVLNAASILQIHSAMTDPVLCYRGAIAWGEFAGDGEFIVGPAIDEAAECERMAEGAFVWLTNSARSALNDAAQNQNVEVASFQTLLVDYPLAVKGGEIVSTHVLNPFFFQRESTKELMSSRMLGSFTGDRMDIVRKRQNTSEFLAKALEQSRGSEEMLRSLA